MSSETEKTYQERMLRVLMHIQQHLDEALRLEDLAAVAHFSPYHFHRIFRGMVGESVKAHVRRLRLERAAHRLKFSDQAVTAIAFEAGYEAHEAFTRAFRAMFDDSPSGFREARRDIPCKQSPSGVHYVEGASLAGFEALGSGETAMQVRVERVEPMRAVFIRHIGPYDAVGPVWQKLYGWAFPRGVVGLKTVAAGVAYDDPDITPPERIRYDACLVVDQPVEPEGEIAVQQIGGGDYAITRHVGPYEKLGDSYAQLCGGWLPGSGRELRSAPALEFYRNSPMNTAAEALITDIFFPLENQP